MWAAYQRTSRACGGLKMTHVTNPLASADAAPRITVPYDDKRADDPVQVKALQVLAEDIRATKVAEISGLDGDLAARFRKAGMQIECVDPIRGEAGQTFDLAIVSSVLERLSEDEVDQMLAAVSRLATNAAFIVSLTFSDHVLRDGRNAHRTIQSRDWWVERIGQHFEHAIVTPFPGPNHICIATWKPSSKTLQRLTRHRKKQTLKKVVPELVTRPFRHALRTVQPGFVSADQLAELARGKSIAIVGNSPKLTLSTHGPDIDAHDIVMRLKRCPIMDVRSHGERTDWFATAVDFDVDLFRDRNPSLFLWMSFRKNPPLKILTLGCPLYCVDSNDQARGASKLGSPPSIGYTAVDLILSLPASKVTIYGFDGMKTASLSSQYIRHTSVIHDHTNEMDVIEELAREHGRCTIVPLD